LGLVNNDKYAAFLVVCFKGLKKFIGKRVDPASAEYWFVVDGGERANGYFVHEFPTIVEFGLSVVTAI